MDKYIYVIDIIEHTEKYSADRLNEILSDPEARDIYNILCKIDSAVEANKGIDIHAEYKHFLQKHITGPRRPFLLFGNRAASIAMIICTSIVAVAAGIAVAVAVTDRPQAGPAAKSGTENVTRSVAGSSDDTIAQDDTAKVIASPIIFEDEPLETVMKSVATTYNVEVKFNNKNAATLHLYYKLDPALPLDEIVSQLNTFEQIDIKHNGNALTID